MSLLLPSPTLTMDLNSEMIKSTADLGVLKRAKKHDSPSDMVKRMLILITLLGVHIRDAANAFGSPEVLMLILSYCDFPTVMAVGRANRHGRRVAQTMIRDRFRFVLSPYIPPAVFGSFVELLQATGSGVTGSVARYMFAIQSRFALHSYNLNKLAGTGNLNIIAGRGQLDACKAWFTQNGYLTWTEKLVAANYRECVVAVWIGEKAVGVDESKILKVMIMHAKYNIVDAILAAPFTSQTNLITGSFAYSLWPNLICKRETMRTDIPYLRGLRRPTKTWLIQFTNGYWNVACGKYCPCVERISSNDEVTASFPWNNNAAPAVVGNDRVDDLWRGKVYVYRFSKCCRNTHCKNYSSNRIVNTT